jgi:guanylate kinase
MKEIELIIISAPSGGGKGTVVKYLLETYPELFTLSVSYCTRDITSEEKVKKLYTKTDHETFNQMVIEGKFVEYEEVYGGDFYGTPVSEVDRAKSEEKILVLDVDVKGACRLKNIYNGKTLFLFIDSGDDVLIYQNRIIQRGRETDPLEKVRKRVARIPQELSDGRFSAHEIIPNNSTIETLQQLTDKVLKNRGLI